MIYREKQRSLHAQVLYGGAESLWRRHIGRMSAFILFIRDGDASEYPSLSFTSRKREQNVVKRCSIASLQKNKLMVAQSGISAVLLLWSGLMVILLINQSTCAALNYKQRCLKVCCTVIKTTWAPSAARSDRRAPLWVKTQGRFRTQKVRGQLS